MEHSFYATLEASIYMDDKDFDLIKECAKNHYDGTVKSSIEVGGFLYGLTNRRDFSNGEDKVLTLSSRNLQLVIKSIEFSNSEDSYRVKKRLVSILHELYDKQKELNSQFQEI